MSFKKLLEEICIANGATITEHQYDDYFGLTIKKYNVFKIEVGDKTKATPVEEEIEFVYKKGIYFFADYGMNNYKYDGRGNEILIFETKK